MACRITEKSILAEKALSHHRRIRTKNSLLFMREAVVEVMVKW